MCTYLKNMEGYKLKDLKSKGFNFIQEMFDRAFKRVNTFEDFRIELVEGKEKRAGEELIQESSKKQKMDDDKETAKLKQCMEIIPNEEEVTIDVIPLAVKSPMIVNWNIHKKGKKSYYQIIRAGRKSQMYNIFSQMIKSFDREDLEDLYKLVKARYGSTKPVESMDYLLWNDMKIMFEPHVEDEVWKLQNGYKVLEWKLYDSCRVQFLRMQSMQIYMLVEKKYPLTPPTLLMMLEKKLQIDYESEMAYQLYKLIIKQLKNLLDAVRITAAQVYVNTALMDLVLLMNFKENILSSYYCCFPSGFVELYDRHGGSFIVNGHRVKLYHDEEQINKLTTKEIHLMCEQEKIKDIPFKAPFPANYCQTMPLVDEKPFIYSVVENTCNEAKLYDLDETDEGIVKGNFLYVKKDPSKKSTLMGK
ncbi:hypothetical protein Tco_0770217 [Tanacetum coccineum]|uniref:Uncharacterized protein n=1 Tax=Tanacetum coccineum TaxID=301880 RepID=A0ABQ4ZDH5_9ASTR